MSRAVRWMVVAATALTSGCRLLPSRDGAGDGGDIIQQRRQQVRLLSEEGLKFEQAGNDRKAHELYKKALKLSPDSAWLHHRMASVCDRLGRFDEAHRHYMQALSLVPRNPSVHNDLGYSYYLRGRLQEAERELRACLALNPNDTRAHNNLGLVLGRLGRSEESLAEFRKAGMSQDQAYASLAFAQADRPPTSATGRPRAGRRAATAVSPRLSRYFEQSHGQQASAERVAVRLSNQIEPLR